MADDTRNGQPKPPVRRLKVYSLDPSLENRLETAIINHITVSIPWEKLEKGPVGEYIEVVDYDPSSQYFYPPVDLNHPHILAQDGLQPSEGNPQFHQQMAYAVAMKTIRNFERALGRPAIWSPRVLKKNGKEKNEYVRRLRIYPHALREANAYYSPSKKALLFGYFPADNIDPGEHLPGGIVFTCLSHDIVAHETTHALLDGVNSRLLEDTNPDVRAFHEAFADIVALFQHFSMQEVLMHQVAHTRGDLKAHNLLGELASQLGLATGSHGALRDAIGRFDEETGEWRRHTPNPSEYQALKEPHALGALLVAAIFDAFIAIYEKRSADLIRIASGGTGKLPEGQLHPDLVNRLAKEAAKSAQHTLTICIRALDYCPPFDITFGEYLRALITADRDLVPNDELQYRVALIEAFRRRGIYPEGIRTLSEESLVWQAPKTRDQNDLKAALPLGPNLWESVRDLDLSRNREQIFDNAEEQRRVFRRALRRSGSERKGRSYRLMGMDAAIGPRGAEGTFEVHSIRPTRRQGPNGRSIADLVVEVSQRRPVIDVDGKSQWPETWSRSDERKAREWFRGGATLLIDVASGEVRYCIGKSVKSGDRWRKQAQYRRDVTDRSLQALYLGKELADDEEPFAALHRLGSEEFDHE